jgi:hypothetical protein
MEANVFKIHTVNKRSSISQLSKAEKSLQDRALARASPANNTNFHSWLNLETQVFYAWLKTFSVFHRHFSEFDFTF